MGLPASHSTTFVGRERELGELLTAFNDAVDGNGRLVMVVGEPGIGKTTLCEELARHVEEQGGTTLVGHCYEEGSLSLPYLAFVEAMCDHVLAEGPDRLAEQLGASAADVARIVPEIRDKLGVEPSAATGPDEDRYRLLQSGSDVPSGSVRDRRAAGDSGLIWPRSAASFSRRATSTILYTRRST